MTKLAIFTAAALMLTGASAFAAGQADTRSPMHSPTVKYYCVKNSETKACEDCYSKGNPAHKSSTCSELKNATNNPLVRSGHCSDRANRDFCKAPPH